MITTKEELEFALLSLDPVTAFRASCMPPEVAELASCLYGYGNNTRSILRRLPQLLAARNGANVLQARVEIIRQRIRLSRVSDVDTPTPEGYSYANALVRAAISSVDVTPNGFAVMSWTGIALAAYPSLEDTQRERYPWTNDHERHLLMHILDAWVRA